MTKSGIRIVHNRLLGGWYVVRGPHQTPLGGRYSSKAEAQASLNRPRINAATMALAERSSRPDFDPTCIFCESGEEHEH